MNSLLELWDMIVESVAVIIIIVTAIGTMVGLVELSLALKRIMLALSYLVLLLVLPPVIVNAWRTLSLWQHIGLIVLFWLAVVLVLQWEIGCSNKRKSWR